MKAVKPFKKKNFKKRKLAQAQHIPKNMKFIKLEEKYFDAASASYAVNTTGSFTLLNGLQKGTDLYGNRIGAKIFATRVQIKGAVGTNPSMKALSGAITAAPQTVRLMVVVDKQPNGAVFAITDVLDTATSRALRNVDHLARFRILYDKTYQVESSNGGTTFPVAGGSVAVAVRDVDVDVAVNVTTWYNNGNAATVADIDTNSIYMFWVGDTAADADKASTFIGGARLSFTDA